MKKTGSTAMLMTYGNYIKEFPQGRKDEDAQADEYGYCMIDNADKTNICWISMASFHLINNAMKTLSKKENKPMRRKKQNENTKKKH